MQVDNNYQLLEARIVALEKKVDSLTESLDSTEKESSRVAVFQLGSGTFRILRETLELERNAQSVFALYMKNEKKFAKDIYVDGDYRLFAKYIDPYMRDGVSIDFEKLFISKFNIYKRVVSLVHKLGLFGLVNDNDKMIEDSIQRLKYCNDHIDIFYNPNHKQHDTALHFEFCDNRIRRLNNFIDILHHRKSVTVISKRVANCIKDELTACKRVSTNHLSPEELQDFQKGIAKFEIPYID